MDIPQSRQVSTVRLGKIFANTVSTYKYFWFLSILQIHAKRDELRIGVWDIVIRMIANAWYPIHYFRLSFGKSDSLFYIVIELQEMSGIHVDADVETICDSLRDRLDDIHTKSRLRKLTSHVPYRFLRPWINTSDDREMVARSQTLENGCLYALHKSDAEFYIMLNPAWDSFLHHHYRILRDFAYWNLTQFLQVRNPNVPAIANKLRKPEQRDSLTNQHRYWDMVINLGGPVRCLYTGKELYQGGYALDHFLPWTFVSHNLNWNLVPSDGSVNSSKCNKLPDLNTYLRKLADLQHRSLRICINAHKTPKALEDYQSLGYTPRELADMDDYKFLEIYERTFKPLNQIALNMGYDTWKYD